MINPLPPIRMRLFAAVVMLFLFCAFGHPVFSQSSTVALSGNVPAPTIKLNVDTVLLNIAVRDRATNRSIAGLTKEDFVVYEDGVGQPVQQFASAEAPFHLLLLLDVSGSTASYLKLMKKAAIEFTRQLKNNDQVAVATFNWRVNLLQDFTDDRSAAARAISYIHSGGGTAFYDAVTTCVNQYMRPIQGRKAIVIFTDGVDNQLFGDTTDGSITTFEALKRKIEEDRSVIYTIFLNTRGKIPVARGPVVFFPGSGRPIPAGPGVVPPPFAVQSNDEDLEGAAYETAQSQLEEIAALTGGRMYSPSKADDLSKAYSEIADDLRIQYLVGYTSPDDSTDRWRSVQVKIKDRPEVVVRTRKGYFATATH